MTLKRGDLLNNRYRVVEILGKGGMGSVYRAVDENLGVEVALKENLFTTEEFARQFRTEAVILASLRHPNLTRVTDHFVIEGEGQYLVMDYIEGEDLRQRMDRIGMISEEEAVIIGAAVCDALSYLHSRVPPVIHRDIKPGNVKITPQGQIYLVDFGLAKLIESGQATTTGARAMTPGYSPPEQYGTARTDNRSDLYSLGATLYAALTGTIPEDALARAMDQVKLTSVQKRNPKVSKRLASILEKSLEVRPDDRFQSAEEFKRSLLSVRGATGPRNSGDYIVTPPPAMPNRLKYHPDASISGPINGDIPYPSDVSEGYSLLTGADINGTLPADRSRYRRRIGCGLFLLVTIILTIGGIAAFNTYPSWPARAQQILASINIPLDLVPEPTPTGSPSPTPELMPSVTPTGLRNTAITSSPSAISEVSTATATLTATLTPTPLPPSLTPTFVNTPVGGGNGEIAFASDRSGNVQVWTLLIDGSSEPHQVTDMPEGACQPDWSPDGKRLVFTSPCQSNQVTYPGSGLFLVNADGTGLTPLPNMPGGDFDPVWSPDGNSIAFTSLRNGGRTRIYLINLEDFTVERLSEQYSYDRQPSWSRDGNKIAFVTTQKGPVQIWIMDSDGSDQEMYTRSADKINAHPEWSPDGQLILFTQTDRPGVVPGLATVTYVEGEYDEYRYQLGPVPAQEARYSPDGLWLVFESWPKGQNHDIYLMTASGAGRTQLTDWERFDFDPVWRPMVATP